MHFIKAFKIMKKKIINLPANTDATAAMKKDIVTAGPAFVLAT